MMPRGRLVWKYAVLFALVVSGALLVSAAIELYFSYQENKAALVALQTQKAHTAAIQIEAFVKEIERQTEWVTQPQLVAPAAALEQRRLDYYRLQGRVPAITEVSHLDAAGKEQIKVSRVAMEVVGSQADFSADPRFREARTRTWFGPVYFRKESEPYMTIAVPHPRGGGVTVVDVNLKFIWDVVSQIRIGKAGRVYVVDAAGNLIAHPDISLVLQKTSLASLEQVRAALGASRAGGVSADVPIARDLGGHRVLTASAAIPALRWTVLAEQPLVEAFEPMRASIRRTLALLGFGIALSLVASVVLARRMVRPIRALQEGAARIGGGELGHRIDVRTGDELEALAGQFNEMTARLGESYATLEQRVVERTRELTEALEQQTATSEILRVISSSPTDVQPVFDTIVRNAARLCGAAYGRVYLLRDESIHLVANYNVAREHLDPWQHTFPRPLSEGGVLGKVLVSGTVRRVPDVMAEEGFTTTARATFQEMGVRSALFVPMLRQSQVIGDITLMHRDPDAFNDAHVTLLQTFADQAVIAIENVRLFTELQEKNRAITEALEQQTATADILRVISRSHTDVGPVFEAIVDRARRLLGGNSAVIGRIVGDRVELAAYTTTDAAGDALLESFFPIPLQPDGGDARPILQQVIGARVPYNVADVETDPRVGERGRAGARARGYRSQLVVPMIRNEHVAGTIAVTRAAPGAFADEDVALLRTFADQAVIAIENARLFNELQEKNRSVTEALEQQTATAEILRVISSSPTDAQPVFDAIVGNAVRLCGADIGAVVRLADGVLLLAAHSDAPPETTERLRGFWPRSLGDPRAIAVTTAIRDQVVVHQPDIETDPRVSDEARALAREIGFRSRLFVPMVREGAAIGVIILANARPEPFLEKQIGLVKTFASQAVIAIQNVRLFTELQEKNSAITEALDHQTATGEILRVISRAQVAVEPVFDAILTSAIRLCDGSGGAIARFDGVAFHLAAFQGTGLGDRDVLDRVYPIVLADAQPWIKHVAKGHIVNIPDATDTAREFVTEVGVHLANKLGYRSILLVPMRQETRIAGFIVVVRRVTGAFSDKHIEVLKTFADQAVIAIENVRLFTELQEKNRAIGEALEQQMATAEILRVISSSPTEVQPVLYAIARSSVRLCDGLFGAVLLYDGSLIHLSAHHNFTPEGLEEFERVYPRPPSGNSSIGRAILERRVDHVSDYDVAVREGRVSSRLPQALGMRSQLSVPMLREGEPIGVIGVARRETGRFTDKQVELLRTFADQAVIAIENVRLFTELQDRTRELSRTVDELEALGEVSRSVTSTLDVDTVLQTIVARASQLAGADGCSIFGYDEATETFSLRATEAPASELRAAQDATTLRRGEGVLGRLPDTREPIQIPDITAEPAYVTPLRDALLRSGYRALLAVPLIREDRVAGGLVVSRKTPGEFSSQTVELLKRFATQSSLALWNASLYREIESKSRELEVANRHKSEFLANMSHELRTPLNAVIGFSEVLIEKMFGDLNDKQEEYLRDIYSSGRHLLSLINDILDLSKIEAGRMELELTTFDLPQAIDNALTLVRGRADAHGIRLDVDVDRRLADFVGDERKFKQILVNLLSNAVKFTPEGGRVSVHAGVANGSVEVSVADTGIGIAPEDREAVFEEFRQVGTDYARKREGTGLGLALTKRFVELHGGSIWLESAPGEGSTFTFALPVSAQKAH